MSDPFVLDYAEPPEGTEPTEAEALLWQGLCPYCAQPAAFAPHQSFDGSLCCLACGFEWLGANDEERHVTTVYALGNPEMAGPAVASLPEVTERTAADPEAMFRRDAVAAQKAAALAPQES